MRADGFSCALGVMLAVLFGLAFSPRRSLYICGRLPPSRRGAGGVPPLQGRGTAVKRRAVPLRVSGGGVASFGKGGVMLPRLRGICNPLLALKGDEAYGHPAQAKPKSRCRMASAL